MSRARTASKKSSASVSSKSETEEESDRAFSTSGTRGPGSMQTGGPAVGLGGSTRGTREVPGIQPKLTVNEPGDKYEKEADRVAEQVMRRSRADEDSGSVHGIMRSTASEANQTVGGEAVQQFESLKGGGRPLQSVRLSFEPRFGRSFSDVHLAESGAVSWSADPAEREVDRVARAAVEGGEPVSITTRADETTVHRKPDGGGTGGGKQSKGEQKKGKRVTQAVEYKEAISTLGKALMQTELGKRLKHEGKELGMEFWSTVGGKVVTLTAAAGGLTFLGVTNRPLPLQPPAFRPDALIPGLEVPGLRVQVAYQGPARDPTKVGLGASFQFGAETPGVMVPGLGDPKLRLDVSSKDPFQGGLEWPKVMLKFSFTTGKSSGESQKAQDQGGSPAKELYQFRQSLKTPEERAAERRILMEMLAPGLDLSEVQRNAPDDSLPGGIQRKLAVNEPNDQYEREAERVADAVMRMRRPEAQQQLPADRIQRICPRCQQRCRQGKPLNCSECEQELRRSAGENSAPPTGGVEQAATVADEPGQPLPDSTRSFFENRMGRDFRDVRVHTGPQAQRAVQSINAEAFTLGNDVAFAQDNYRPDTTEGKELIAHELTHVIQQTGAKGSGTIQVNRMIMPYRHKNSANFGAGDDGLKEKSLQEWRNAGYTDGLPTIKNIKVEFNGIKKTPKFKSGDGNKGEIFPTGKLTATYYNSSKTVTANVSGGAATAGFSQSVNEAPVKKMEGPGYDWKSIKTRLKSIYTRRGLSEERAMQKAGKYKDKFMIEESEVGGSDIGQQHKYWKQKHMYSVPQMERKQRAEERELGAQIKKEMLSWIDPQQAKAIDPEQKKEDYKAKTLRALMNYAIYFYGDQALHEGYDNTGSLACVHVPQPPMRQLNYHTVPVDGITTVTINYDSATLEELCCRQRNRVGKTVESDEISGICSDTTTENCANNFVWFTRP